MTSKELVNHLEEVTNISTKALASQGSVNKVPRELYIASFYSSIIQYAEAIISLLKEENLIAIPPIFRSLLEAYVELINLCKYEKNYTHVLNSLYLWQRIKKFQATFKEPDNPFLQHTIENYEDIGYEIKKLKKQKVEVDKRISDFDGNLKQIKKRFELAGLKDAYTGIYSQLCEDSHNGILRVESRHIKEENDKITFSIETNWDLEDIAPHIITTVDILKSSLMNVSHHLEFPKADDFLDQIEEKKELIESYL